MKNTEELKKDLLNETINGKGWYLIHYRPAGELDHPSFFNIFVCSENLAKRSHEQGE